MNCELIDRVVVGLVMLDYFLGSQVEHADCFIVCAG